MLAERFRRTDTERTELLPSGGTFKFASRGWWARMYLQQAGLLEAPRRGYFRRTARGAMVLKQSPAPVDNTRLAQFEEFKAFQGKKRLRGASEATAQETPIESLSFFSQQYREALDG